MVRPNQPELVSRYLGNTTHLSWLARDKFAFASHQEAVSDTEWTLHDLDLSEAGVHCRHLGLYPHETSEIQMQVSSI